ncbi:T9SS type A sorting domain-containing protein [Chryseobacterium sp. T1]
MKRIFIIFVSILSLLVKSQKLDIEFTPNLAADYIEPIRILSIEQQDDGKILVGGYFGGTYCLKRLNLNGTTDASFIAPIYGGGVSDIAVQSDGKIIVVGAFFISGSSQRFLCRLNTDGSLDNTFNIGTGSDAPIKKVLVQPDGKILICGGFWNYDNNVRSSIARLNSDGSLDEDFNADVFVSTNSIFYDIKLLDNNQILAAADIFGSEPSYGVVRLNPNGTKDFSFKTDLLNSNIGPRVESIAVQDDGKILMAGLFRFTDEDFNQPNKYLARLLPNGELDLSFHILDSNNVNHETAAFLKKVIIEPDGNILIAGEISKIEGRARPYLAKLLNNGLLDFTFDTGIGSDKVINTIGLQHDGKILLGGEFLTYDHKARRGIARILNDHVLSVVDVSKQYKIFPNPASDFINIETGREIERIQVIDMEGRLIIEHMISDKNYKLNIENLPKGVYTLRIINNTIINKKIIKQ